METSTYPFRKIVIGAAVIIGVFVGASWLYSLLTTTTITVTTNNSSDYVSVAAIKNGSTHNTNSYQALHTITVHVKAGSYQIAAYSKSYEATKIISVKARQTVHYLLNPVAATNPSAVYGNAVSGLTADGSQLLFIDSNGLLTRIDSGNTPAVLFPGTQLLDAMWANSGLGLARDSSNNLYSISNGVVNKLTLPFVPTAQTSLSYAVSVSGDLYVSDGSHLYRGTIAGGNFSIIYSYSGTILSLAATSDKVALTKNPLKNVSDPEGVITVITKTGKISNSGLYARQISWSPDGQHLLAGDDSGFAILTAALATTDHLPLSATAIPSFAWADDHTVYYSQDGSLWTYDSNVKQSNTLAAAPAQANIHGVYPSSDGSYVYITAESPDLGGGTARGNELFRIGLKGQPVNDSLSGLSLFLPEVVDGGSFGLCNLNYIDFDQPILLFSYAQQLGGAQQNCQSLAQGEVQKYGLNVDTFQYVPVAQN